jgi:acyl-CoA thioester hydrolase
MAVVHPWLCDAMGHLTTRNYLGMFDDASYQLFMMCGYDGATAGDWGWADVRHEIEYKNELQAGAVVKLFGRIAKLGKSSVTSDFRLLEGPGEKLCATLVATTVCFDLGKRSAMALPQTFAANARMLFGLPSD